MAKHNTVGKIGEQLAQQWLINNHFAILETNWRYKRLEADIIATKTNTLHIIEVKTRTNTKFGMPEDSVTPKKIEHMLHLGMAYKQQNNKYTHLQYDILAIIIPKNKVPEYFYLPDIYL